MKNILIPALICFVSLCQAQVYTSEVEVQSAANGDVGIGTTAPQAKLHIYGGDLLLQNYNGSGYPSLWSKNADGTISTQFVYNALISTGSKFYLRATSNLILNDTGGNVGLGTASPNSKFHMRNSAGNATMIVQSKQDGSSSRAAEIVFSHEYSGANVTSGAQTGRKALIRATNRYSWGTSVRLGFFTSSSTGSYPIERMVVSENGNVGIANTNPSYKLDISGTARASAWYTTSDERMKKNVRSVSKTSDLKHVKAYKYEMKGELEDGRSHYGLLAQEIEAVYPDLVVTDSAGFKAVAYQEFIPLLIERVNNQEEELSDLKKVNADLRNRLVAIENRLKK